MLGVGSFGRTYLGRDIKKSKEVAIKIVRHKILKCYYRCLRKDPWILS